MRDKLRPCWQNCGGLDDKSLLEDKEILAIDAMEDSIGPLDDNTVGIRGLITRFESCYHEADKEAEMIVGAIGSGQIPVESNDRPPQRKQELQNTHDILSAWCQDEPTSCKDLCVGPVSAKELFDCLGKPTDLKRWQVQRMIDQLKWALDRSYSYHVMALDMDGFGQPIELKAKEYYKDHLDFLNQTTTTMIHYTLDGKDSEMSLALAIDLHSPCNWNFIGNLVILLKAINGDLHPKESFAPCSLNASLTLLRGRLQTIANTLRVFWKNEKIAGEIDNDLLISLGTITPVKQWLAASLDKTIRLRLSL